MKFKMPLIVVKDMVLSRKFYEEVLNQKVEMDFGEKTKVWHYSMDKIFDLYKTEIETVNWNFPDIEVDHMSNTMQYKNIFLDGGYHTI